MEPASVSVRAADVAALLAARRPDAKALDVLLGGEARTARAIRRESGAGYTFLSADVASARRTFVLLDLGALVTFDVVVSPEPRWSLEDAAGILAHITIRSQGGLFLNVLERAASRRLPAAAIDSVELAGVRVADRVCVFHADVVSARAAVSFDVKGSGTLKYVIAGLVPGTWEIWWNGYLEDPEGVASDAGVLYFERPAGDYYLRRLR